MPKFFNIFKTICSWPIFWPVFPIFGARLFSGKSGSVTQNFIWVSSIMPKFRKKLIIQFQENAQREGRVNGQMEGWMDGWKDGQTLFYSTLPATARGPIKIAIKHGI